MNVNVAPPGGKLRKQARPYKIVLDNSTFGACFMSFDEAYSWALFSITFTSVNIQVYVIWVILTKSPPAMHEYRYFLCVYTVSYSTQRVAHDSLSLSPLGHNLSGCGYTPQMQHCLEKIEPKASPTCSPNLGSKMDFLSACGPNIVRM